MKTGCFYGSTLIFISQNMISNTTNSAESLTVDKRMYTVWQTYISTLQPYQKNTSVSLCAAAWMNEWSLWQSTHVVTCRIRHGLHQTSWVPVVMVAFYFLFFYPECAFTDSKTEACDLRGPEESEHRRPPSRTVHPQHAGRTRAGQAAWQ